MPDESYEVAVIGAGPGGYVAAIRSAQLGLKTVLIEKNNTLGGTCLNVGCIPSKALLHTSELFYFTSHEAERHGIKTSSVSLDLGVVMKKKEATVSALTKGIDMLISKRGIKRIEGTGRLTSPNTISITTQNGEITLNAEKIILATGSAPIELPFLPFDGKTVVSSDHGIAFTEVPKKLIVVGAGAIGLELGSVWSRFGSEVTIVEFLDKIAPGLDDDVSRQLERLLKKQGLKFELSTKVTGLKKNKRGFSLTAESKGKDIEFDADKILVSVGRKPYTDGLGLEEVGIELDETKRIKTDKNLQTNIPNIYAIGDIVSGPMLAHKAEEEGVAVAERIAGKAGHVNYHVIPNVIYTDPEVAGVGITEADAKEQNLAIKTGKIPFAANGRALASDGTNGFAKVIADAQTDKILGVQIIGKNASELIAEAVAHMEYGGSAEDLGRTIHAHPTLSETLKEAGMAVSKTAIHSL